MSKYKYTYKLKERAIIKMDGFPLEHLGNGEFGTNTEMQTIDKVVEDIKKQEELKRKKPWTKVIKLKLFY